mgnify:CR=1 FL=1
MVLSRLSRAHNFDPDTISRLIDGSMCHEMFLEMDSTNSKKFSRHLVLNMRPGIFSRIILKSESS